MEAHASKNTEAELRTAAQWLSEATHVLVGAGAGMSTEAGVDYHDKKTFAELHPGMVKRGYTFPYQLVGHHDWEPALQWGYLSEHVHRMRYTLPPTKVYGDLIDIIKNKEHFVLTSNVDGMFERNSLDPSKVYTVQGDMQYIQCLKPCSKQVWPMLPYIQKMLPHVDRATQELKNHDVIPKCPNCSGPMMMNVRGGDWFVEDHFKEQAQRMAKFLQEATKPGNKLVLLEIGAGFNTPTVIRHRFEIITYQRMHQSLPCKFIRLNLHIPEEISSVSLSLRGKVGEALDQIKRHLPRTEQTAV